MTTEGPLDWDYDLIWSEEDPDLAWLDWVYEDYGVYSDWEDCE